jgi:hypothetical protein
MMMRYYFGLAVGHTYAYGSQTPFSVNGQGPQVVTSDDEEVESEPSGLEATAARVPSDSEDSAFDMDRSEVESEDPDDAYSDEEFHAVDEMYGF